MTVYELIEKLKEFNPEAKVTVRTWENYFEVTTESFEAFAGELVIMALD